MTAEVVRMMRRRVAEVHAHEIDEEIQKTWSGIARARLLEMNFPKSPHVEHSVRRPCLFVRKKWVHTSQGREDLATRD